MKVNTYHNIIIISCNYSKPYSSGLVYNLDPGNRD